MDALDKYAAKRQLMFAMEKHAGIASPEDMQKEAFGLAVARAMRGGATGMRGASARAAKGTAGMAAKYKAPPQNFQTNIAKTLKEGVRRGGSAVSRFAGAVGRTGKRIGEAARSVYAKGKGLVQRGARKVSPSYGAKLDRQAAHLRGGSGRFKPESGQELGQVQTYLRGGGSPGPRGGGGAFEAGSPRRAFGVPVAKKHW
jgi:hypothetical protein